MDVRLTSILILVHVAGPSSTTLTKRCFVASSLPGHATPSRIPSLSAGSCCHLCRACWARIVCSFDEPDGRWSSPPDPRETDTPAPPVCSTRGGRCKARSASGGNPQHNITAKQKNTGIGQWIQSQQYCTAKPLGKKTPHLQDFQAVQKLPHQLGVFKGDYY